MSYSSYPIIPSWHMLTNANLAAQYGPIGPSTYFNSVNGPCPGGEHDFELVPEDGLNLLAVQRERLVLYCRRCGASIQHDLSSPESNDDP